MDFNKVILMTDLDGTLLTDDKRITPQDMAAINRFRSGGGRFTIATGRGYSMAAPVAEKLSLDMPAVIFNGAAVYDFTESRFLWHSEIGNEAVGYVRTLIERFPDIAIEILREKTVYVPSINEIERMHLAYENVAPVLCGVDEVPRGGWLKVLIAYFPEKMQSIVDFAAEHCSGNVNWVRSEAHYFEMLPQNVSKGSGFAELLKIIGEEELFTVGVGDYMNDYDMIKTAKLGVAVATAQQEVKAAADLIVCDNNSGAIAETIRCIENL